MAAKKKLVTPDEILRGTLFPRGQARDLVQKTEFHPVRQRGQCGLSKIIGFHLANGSVTVKSAGGVQ
jgi:hypothetical protein